MGADGLPFQPGASDMWPWWRSVEFRPGINGILSEVLQDIWCIMVLISLVGGWPTPLKNMSSSVCQLGLWHSQYVEKCSKPPTRSSYEKKNLSQYGISLEFLLMLINFDLGTIFSDQKMAPIFSRPLFGTMGTIHVRATQSQNTNTDTNITEWDLDNQRLALILPVTSGPIKLYNYVILYAILILYNDIWLWVKTL